MWPTVFPLSLPLLYVDHFILCGNTLVYIYPLDECLNFLVNTKSVWFRSSSPIFSWWLKFLDSEPGCCIHIYHLFYSPFVLLCPCFLHINVHSAGLYIVCFWLWLYLYCLFLPFQLYYIANLYRAAWNDWVHLICLLLVSSWLFPFHSRDNLLSICWWVSFAS